jgi:hypothetical protein
MSTEATFASLYSVDRNTSTKVRPASALEVSQLPVASPLDFSLPNPLVAYQHNQQPHIKVTVKSISFILKVAYPQKVILNKVAYPLQEKTLSKVLLARRFDENYLEYLCRTVEQAGF